MNAKSSPRTTATMVRLVSALLFAVMTVGSVLQVAESAQDSTRQASTKKRPTYFPNTERLGSDEMRVTALGTGLPTPITRAQKSTAWMVELGNGDVFPFDIGTGSMENLFGLRPSTFLSSYIHTPPQGFGKVMSEIKPRMAIAFHTVLSPDIQQGMFEGIRKTCDGPLTIANDQ